MNSAMHAKRQRVYVLLSAALYSASLTQNAFFIGRADYDAWASPVWLVLVGWIGMLMGGGAALVWFTNPLLFLSWGLSFSNHKIAKWLSTFTALLAASFLLFDEIITSEAPTYSSISHYGAGYWLWLASCVLFAICMWVPAVHLVDKPVETSLD